MTRIECPGLDGSNPLHYLASLGVLKIGFDCRLIRSMNWIRSQHWHPQYTLEAGIDMDALCRGIAEFIVSAKVSSFREKMEIVESEYDQLCETESTLKTAKVHAVKDELVSIREKLATVVSHKARLSKRLKRMAPYLEAKAPANACASYALRMVYSRFPIVIRGFHLDDIEKGGVSDSSFRSESVEHLNGSHSCVDLSGLAASGTIREKRNSSLVEYIKRTHFSFANNNSGKQLLKDFASSAALCTTKRIHASLMGLLMNKDPITGLGWDPASQKAYALQFANPQDDVSSSVAINVLAFIGLSHFCVCPMQTGRATIGFSRLPTEQTPEIDDGDDTSESAGRQRVSDMFSWPIWTSDASVPVVRSLLGLQELHTHSPDKQKLVRIGVAEVFRSRRFSANKRSFFSPSRNL